MDKSDNSKKAAAPNPEPVQASLAPGERPTLKTISRLSGLAVPTVSRALSDAPDIGQRTKERVQAIAQQIGYRPNRAGLRLRTGKTQVISLVLSTDYDVMNQTAVLIGSIARGLRGTDYHLNVNPSFADDRMSPIRYIVESGSADGIIMNATLPDDPRVNYLREVGFPFATHGRTSIAEKHAYFDFDHVRLGQLILGEFAKRSRRCVFLIPPPKTQNYSQDLIRGAQQTADKHGMTLTIPEQTNCESPLEEIEATIHSHFKRFPETDALLSASTTAALGAIATVDNLGLTIGTDVDVCTREIIPLLGRFRPGILTVDEDVSRAGQFLAKAILQAIEHPEMTPLQALEVPENINVFS
ncbi:MAG: LacI family transcriptional regulator [Granulosicoccus sp.]